MRLHTLLSCLIVASSSSLALSSCRGVTPGADTTSASFTATESFRATTSTAASTSTGTSFIASGTFGHYPMRIVALSPEALAAEAQRAKGEIEPRDPLERLIAGNARFVAGKTRHLRQDAARRTEVALGQKPFAVVVACADSRVAPETLFDQGLGDLFVVRCAGNVVDDLAVGSIEYAVEHLGARVIVVVGHERCGAVTAALEGGHLPGHIGHLVEAIRPHLGDLPSRGKAALDEAVRANASAVAAQLAASEPILSEFEHQGKLRVLAARYDLDTGAVEFLSSTHP